MFNHRSRDDHVTRFDSYNRVPDPSSNWLNFFTTFLNPSWVFLEVHSSRKFPRLVIEMQAHANFSTAQFRLRRVSWGFIDTSNSRCRKVVEPGEEERALENRGDKMKYWLPFYPPYCSFARRIGWFILHLFREIVSRSVAAKFCSIFCDGMRVSYPSVRRVACCAWLLLSIALGHARHVATIALHTQLKSFLYIESYAAIIHYWLWRRR